MSTGGASWQGWAILLMPILIRFGAASEIAVHLPDISLQFSWISFSQVSEPIWTGLGSSWTAFSWRLSI